MTNVLSSESELVKRELFRMQAKNNARSLRECSDEQDRLGKIMSLRAMRRRKNRVIYREIDFGCFQAAMAVPIGYRRENGAALYLHGGGYVAGTLDCAKGFGGELAGTLGKQVLCAAYRLAPRSPFPAALDDAYAAYRRLVSGFGFAPTEISFIGESAGGGLALALCHKLKAENYPLPREVVAVSPWADLTFGADRPAHQRSYNYKKALDPSLDEVLLHQYAEHYAPGRDRRDPLISPLFGDVSGFSRTMIVAGGDELLLDDAERLYFKLLEQGVECELLVGQGMWHVYPCYIFLPEAKKALRRIKAFMGVGDAE